MKKIYWTAYTLETLEDALSANHCLYVLHSPDDGDRPHYIGKAKFFGTKQADGYKASARYNSGYVHLLAGMLRGGYTLYIAQLGTKYYEKAEGYEQELIHKWNPIRTQMLKPRIRRRVTLTKPWR